MKKLFFSAVALIAFSSVSMGNTINLKEKKIVDVSSKTKIVVNSACHSLSFSVYIASRESGYSVSQSTANANSAYFQCMSAALPKSVSIK
ncbi:hypothetical protein [Flavobacterium dankookense]|uniref:Uncharacterized protein n=1 Tax=Flavobacterium dankookense TaxID=706186 RepID=A0A4V3CSN7_9FLAO|nr:hypothetical protein [Flavobacterium dankookense]TDP61314.1 hypothetical protein BC748_0242 [Flavobacterium dankookense]